MWGHGLDRASSGQGQVADTCECGNELMGSIQCGEFLENRLGSKEGLFYMDGVSK